MTERRPAPPGWRGRPDDAARCRPPRPTLRAGRPRCRRASQWSALPRTTARTPRPGPAREVNRGDQRRMVVIGQPDRFAGLHHQPAQTGAAPDRQPPVVIRTDSLMHRHRELPTGVTHRRGRDVPARDNPGARNQGADDGLDVLVQPDRGRSGSHHSTLTGSVQHPSEAMTAWFAGSPARPSRARPPDRAVPEPAIRLGP